MYGFGRMQEVAPRARRSERGDNLLPDQSGLANACHQNTASAAKEKIDRADEIVSQPIAQRGDGSGFFPQDFACQAHLFLGREGIRRRRPWFRMHARRP
jgi:hypothetical protein